MGINDPLAILSDAMAVMDLIIDLAAVSGRLATADRAAADLAADAASRDSGLRQAWLAATDGARRDVLTTMAELAARHGVDRTALDMPGAADRDVYLTGAYACDLLDLAAEELGTHHRSRSLIPDSPGAMATGPTGIYAMSTVCDSTESETAKLAAAVALAIAAQRAAPTDGVTTGKHEE